MSSKSGVLFKFSPGSCRSSRILDLSDNAATPVVGKVNTCACVQLLAGISGSFLEIFLTSQVQVLVNVEIKVCF